MDVWDEPGDREFAFRVVILVEYVAVAVLSSISVFVIYFALSWMWRMRQSKCEVTPCLLVYLSTLMVSNFALAINAAVVSSFWRTDSFANTQTVFWVGLLSGCLIGASPAGITFLALDRLLVVARPFYNTAVIRKYLAVGSSLTISVLFLSFMALNISEAPTEQNEECWSFGCVTSTRSRSLYAAIRTVFAVSNFVLGATFFLLATLRKRRLRATTFATQLTERNKTGNRLALVIIAMEFIFDLVPSVTYTISTYIFGENISVYVGAFRSVTYTLNSFSCSIAQTAILRKLRRRKAGRKSFVLPMPINRRNTVGAIWILTNERIGSMM